MFASAVLVVVWEGAAALGLAATRGRVVRGKAQSRQPTSMILVFWAMFMSSPFRRLSWVNGANEQQFFGVEDRGIIDTQYVDVT